MHNAATKGHLEVVKLLISKGANVNAENDNGTTPLHYAAKGKTVEIAKLLLEKGADVNAKSKGDWTPLQMAVRYDQPIGMAKLLIKAGADVDAKNKNAWTPITLAAWQGQAEIVKLLIEKGADINAKNKNGDNALKVARGQKKDDTVRVIQRAGRDIGVWSRYRTTGTIESHKEFIQKYPRNIFVASAKAGIPLIKKRVIAEKKRIAVLKRKQKCRMKEDKWIYRSNSCSSGYAHGKGDAMHVDGKLNFKGKINNGVRVSGVISYDGQTLFDGPIVGGRPDGKGICFYKGEPEECRFYHGKRVDGIFKQRIAMAEQKAEMQKLRKDVQKDISDLMISQAAQGQRGESMGDIVKKEVTRKAVDEIFNRLF